MPRSVSPFDVVALAASAGGIEATTALLAALPARFPVPIVAVIHRMPIQREDDVLARILRRNTRLQVKRAVNEEWLCGGTVYLAPPDRHVVVTYSRMIRLLDSDKVNHSRPSADVLFKSVASRLGDRSIAVVLSGKLRDGAAGADAIRRAGGRVFAQDEASSEHFGMPSAAIANGAAEFVLTPVGIANAITALVMVPGAASLFRISEDTPARMLTRELVTRP